MTDAGFGLSPFRRPREISLALVIDHDLGTHLPRFSTITSGTVSKITFTVQPASRTKEFYSLSGSGCDWTGIDEELLRLAETQGGNNACRVELVMDLGLVRLGQSHSSGREGERFERNLWIRSASKYVFPKFFQTGTIDFILPLPVSESVLYSRLYFLIGVVFTLRLNPPPVGTHTHLVLEIVRPALVLLDIGLNVLQLPLYVIVRV